MKYDSKIPNKMVFKEFWQGIKPWRLAFFGSLLFFTIGLAVNMFVPVLYKGFFDTISTSIDKATVVSSLINTLVLIIVLHLVNWVFYRFGMLIFNAMETSVMARLKQNAFGYLMLHSHNFFANSFTGSLVQRVNRFSRAFERLADSFTFNILPLMIYIIGSIVITFLITPVISLFIIIWVIVFLTFNIFFSRWKQKYDIAVAQADSHTTAILSDDITNYSSITLFTGYDDEVRNYREATFDQSAKLKYSWNLGSLVDMVQSLFLYAVEFAVFYYAIFYWAQDHLTVGTLVLVQVYIIGLSQQLWGASRIVRTIYEGLADAKEMVEIMNLPYEIKNLPKAKEIAIKYGRIVFKDVSFSFNDTREVLNNIDLEIRSGEKIALVGPSGSGKTTLARLIMRFYDLADGVIAIDGQDIKDATLNSLHKNISLVPQDPVLFHRSLMENIRYGRRSALDEEVIAAAKLAHCDEFIEDLPLKYETFVGERGIKLSGGERQRVAIARAILKDSPILILDEATSSLDSHSEKLIQDALNTLMRGRTTIVIAHRLSTIRKMDRILVIDAGQIAESGTHDELILKPDGLYQKLWQLQVSGFITDQPPLA